MTPLALVRIAHIGSCVVAFGLLAFELLVAHTFERYEGAVRTAVGIALASWLAWLAVLASQMSGQPVDQALRADVLSTVLGETTFGHVWLIRFALLVLAGVVSFPTRLFRVRPHLWLAMKVILCAAVLGSLAWTGHALGGHAPHALIDAAHVLAAGLWVGMLLPLVSVIACALTSAQPDSRRYAATAAKRFSVSGMVAVATLASSGALNAWWLLGSWSAFVTTDYGRLLAAKIACFGFMLVLASVNRWILVPRIRADSRVDGRSMQPLGWLLCSVACELVLGVVVLVLAAFLGITPPASHEHSGHAMHHIM